jgi:hypothetical protein
MRRVFRSDRIDKTTCFTLRCRSKLHHFAVGRVHQGKRVLIVVADLDVQSSTRTAP